MPSEIAPVVKRLNDLLDQLATAFERERALTADMAHELRTPIAGLRTTLEVALAPGAATADHRETLADALQITLSMQGLVSNMLILARLDAEQVPLRVTPVTLAALVDDCWNPHCREAAVRTLQFQNRLPQDLVCRADDDMLRIVFGNLLENATKYANVGGSIWVDGRRNNGCVEITVANTGCTLEKHHLCHVFDRFWRGDAGRNETGLHAGLGLAWSANRRRKGGQATVTLDHSGVFAIHLAWQQP